MRVKSAIMAADSIACIGTPRVKAMTQTLVATMHSQVAGQASRHLFSQKCSPPWSRCRGPWGQQSLGSKEMIGMYAQVGAGSCWPANQGRRGGVHAQV